MKNRKAEKLHKLLVYILGYKPYEFGLIPDKDGFVKIKDLIKAVCEEKELPHIKATNIDEIMVYIKNPEIEIESAGIRAKKSKAPDIAKNAVPPSLLYTCIRRRAQQHIYEKGISSGEEKCIVLSSDESMAERIGKRKDNKPIMLSVSTKLATDSGVSFDFFGGDIYLAEFIPPGTFNGPPLAKEKIDEKKTVNVPEKKTPGSFTLKNEKTPRKKEISWKRDKKRLRREKNFFRI